MWALVPEKAGMSLLGSFRKITYLMELLGVIPGLDQAVANGVGSSLISTLIVKVEASASQSVLDVIDD